MSVLIGMNRQFKLQAAILVIVSFVLVCGGTITASLIVLTRTDLVPKDFCQKGTLSNVSQDMGTPQGRLWSTALVVCNVLLLMSMYPFYLHRCWAPWVNEKENPLVHPSFQSKGERLLRTIWVIFPCVGFILTGIVPSLSGAQGFDIALTAVHNVAAPLSMLLCMVMETTQLHFGEGAINALLYGKVAAYGPLSSMQKLRVVTLFASWAFGMIFVGVQAYLNFFENSCGVDKDLDGFLDVKEQQKAAAGGGKFAYRLALVSFGGEVLGLLLNWALPAIAGMEYLLNMESGSVIDEMNRLITNHLATPVSHPVDSSAETTKAKTS